MSSYDVEKFMAYVEHGKLSTNFSFSLSQKLKPYSTLWCGGKRSFSRDGGPRFDSNVNFFFFSIQKNREIMKQNIIFLFFYMGITSFVKKIKELLSKLRLTLHLGHPGLQ